MNELISNNKKAINKEKIIIIITAIILLLAMIIYEFGLCNAKFTKGIINGNIEKYNFSFARMVIYLVYAILYFKYIGKFTKDAVSSLRNKYKLITIAIVYIIFAVAFVYAIMTGMIKYKLVLMTLDLLLGTVLLIYISNDLKKNMIIVCATLGILFCCTTQLNGSLDEKRHFMSAFNMSIGNFDYKHNNKTEESIEQIPRVCPLQDSMQFFEKKYENKIYENNDTHIDFKATTYSPILYLPSAIGIKTAILLQGSIADIYIIRTNI